MERKIMSSRFQPTALVGAIAIALGFSTTVQANENLASTTNAKLNTLVVTATRSEQNIKEIPARISIIEPQLIEQSPIAELPHLLMNDASINMVQSGGFGQQASIFTRGTNSTHTLVLRDGVRLNGVSAGFTPLALLDTTDIKQIEVLKGPASVLYGTDAIGGVVQLITKTPEKSGVFMTSELGEHNTYKAVVGADFAENGVYAQVRSQRLESDGTPVLNSKNNPDSSYDQKGFSAKLGVEKEQYASSIDFSHNQGNNVYDLSGSPTSQDFANQVINLKGRVNLNSDIALHARLSQFKDDIVQQDAPDYVKNTTQEAEAYAQWQATSHNRILAGVSHKNLTADVLSLSEWSSVDYDESTKSTGYFLQHQYQTEKLNTQVGIRLEDHEKFGSHTVGQLAARYFFTPSTSLYSNIGTAFRAPTSNDLYAISWGANPLLKPEESFSYELGVDHQINHNVAIGLSAYHNQVDNLITFSNGQLDNVNKATFTGAEFNLDWQYNALFASLSYAFVQPKNDQTKQDLTRRPRHSTTLSAGWNDDLFGLTASVSAKSSSTDFADWPSTTPTKTPRYVTADLNAHYNIHPNVKLFANVQNIADVKYKTAYNGNGIYYINGGRLASAGVTFKY